MTKYNKYNDDNQFLIREWISVKSRAALNVVDR